MVHDEVRVLQQLVQVCRGGAGWSLREVQVREVCGCRSVGSVRCCRCVRCVAAGLWGAWGAAGA